MKNLFYGVLVLYLIFFISCSGKADSQAGNSAATEIYKDIDSIKAPDYYGHWGWNNSGEAAISMTIFSHKDSVGYYLYTYYFGNRIRVGYVKLLSQDGRNAVLLVGDDKATIPWSAKFNATMLTDTSFFLTRQKPEDYYLEDSIVLTRCYHDQELEEGRWVIEDYKRTHRD
ncbi:hypothetical protein [Coprobacter fastidiosus]|uniref:Lipoprotein n=1 Tax=Coprobacter fastidiosus NSB1 = JCM 33896 TaxID=1349822 RepID=A0A495WFD5_9BACT|nr:hypothetical protein [Coprobacter fastidiosus]EHL82967.1 hypothetical protein HMPREF1033_02203 [Tannerella sp. 6_1_58FAA_CT1]RHO62816.1 hypothetical protein DW107_00250 [Tannerella sp. AM09-19]ERM90195.1 hypothetical protein NSB1T_01475 [Coprobacter fastidiosus NSB1 = JCM 33896]PWM06453.1 MAG: hypothetical protein DBY02_08635 [Coprobacter fastidiosus]RKT59980.1 hypothetical protein BC742_0909 [Coprobacter fastidiosus NSB1 = JCM 33896]